MKLVRAQCPCGFATRKGPCRGYHFHQWWFPVYCQTTGCLTDAARSFPANECKEFDRMSCEVLVRIPHDRNEQRNALAQIEARCMRQHELFIASATRALQVEYANRPDHVFDPPCDARLNCPQCRNETLCIERVVAMAHCKCGLEYEWPDSEAAGCPQCGHRPHRFRTEHEPADLPRTPERSPACRCSSSLDSISHVDAFCPKCGELPETYNLGDKSYCGVHHEPLHAYRVPETCSSLRRNLAGLRISFLMRNCGAIPGRGLHLDVVLQVM